MIKTPQAIIILVVCIANSILFARTANACNQTCGAKQLQYPFGFSSGCPIPLNCTVNGTVLIGEFPVQTLASDHVKVHLQANCNRPIENLNDLFSRNFAPTSHNGILLRDCEAPVTRCPIPSTAVQTRFELKTCDSKSNKSDNVSCYSETRVEREFMDLGVLKGSGCRSLFSAIAVETAGNGSEVTLDVQVVKLGWWLEGGCACSDNANCTEVTSPVNGHRGFRCQCLDGFVGDGFRGGSGCRRVVKLGWWLEGGCACSDNANCTEVTSPVNGHRGFRCRCLDGFVGDGFRSGFGCRRASSSCDPAEFVSAQCNGTTRVGILVGGVAAGASLMIGVGLICCFIRRRYKLKNQKRNSRRLCEATGISIPIYPYREIERATNFFSDKQRLGTGAYGTVYAGKLNKDEWVAIKRIKHGATDCLEQVVNEIKLISSVSHPNLVRLLGCSIEKGEQILVYEFMPNGTLSQHLQRERSEGLKWPVRLTILAETAQAIAYLHSSINPPIYHRDIKSSNILLDYNFKSKVADFGLSRVGMIESSHISTAPQGTPGYLDPQYHQNFHLSDKSDVYSFGVVIVEIITGLKALDFGRPQNEINLAALATDRIGKGSLEEIIDPLLEQIVNDEWALSSMHKVAELAFRCLAYDRDTRPSMMEVAAELEQIRLSRWAISSEDNITTSSEASRWGSSFDASEPPKN
ncbi:Wall-associated receptor kinase-like [Actinidia chinensis var. chinensis]|uniref:Wall-associated receptor kinase-like n=1 Tax=Actinidia chinensis var. chinensis TaxID=1590841 RepID=A0A2R6QXZ1_ACTCC|nr:Wall-associated receptor kinase-like [Actinidia chinensis var. chinensis]